MATTRSMTKRNKSNAAARRKSRRPSAPKRRPTTSKRKMLPAVCESTSEQSNSGAQEGIRDTLDEEIEPILPFNPEYMAQDIERQIEEEKIGGEDLVNMKAVIADLRAGLELRPFYQGGMRVEKRSDLKVGPGAGKVLSNEEEEEDYEA
ncbi:hypothetical protein ABW21_db0208104 [Orbilia brochopaga]|nr:hypothetical protein ABW21_db0208104 [Drechslerella brochopaga]